MTKGQEKGRAGGTPAFASGRKRFILWFDLFLLAGFVLLLSPRMTGLGAHELIGIVFSILLIVHLLIAWPWISATTKRLLSSVNPRTRVNFSLNAVLFILTIIELFSGLVISQVVLPFAGISTINDRSWRALHNLTLNWTMLAAGLHIAINWEWILSALRRPPMARDGLEKGPMPLAPGFAHGVRRIGLVVLAASIVGAGAYVALGKPSAARLYVQDEIARFTPTFGHGVGQLAGETLLLGLIAYVGYRWMRMRL